MAPQQKQRKVAIVGSRSVGTHTLELLRHPTALRRTRSGCSSAQSSQRTGHMTQEFGLISALAGKSSLTVQYVDGHFVDSYYPTIENTFSKVIRYKNQDFATEIIDTAGQVRHSLDNIWHAVQSQAVKPVYGVFMLEGEKVCKQSFKCID